jgi:hypothetical protein
MPHTHYPTRRPSNFGNPSTLDLESEAFEAMGLAPEVARRQARSTRFLAGRQRGLERLQASATRLGEEQAARGVSPAVTAGLSRRAQDIAGQLESVRAQQAGVAEMGAAPLEAQRLGFSGQQAATRLAESQAYGEQLRARAAGLTAFGTAITGPLADYLGTRATAGAQERTAAAAQARLAQNDALDVLREQRLGMATASRGSLDQARIDDLKARATPEERAIVSMLEIRLRSAENAANNPSLSSADRMRAGMEADRYMEELMRRMEGQQVAPLPGAGTRPPTNTPDWTRPLQ